MPPVQGDLLYCERSKSVSYNVFSLILVQTLKTDDWQANQIYERIK